MKKLLAVFMCLMLAFTVTACSSGGGNDDAMKNAAGTYKGIYSKYVGDGDDAKNTSEAFTLELKEDGTGTHHRDDLDIDVKWELNGEEFKMTETFMGTIDYNGTLKDNKLDIFNGDKDNELTYEYVYEKE